MTDYSQKGHYYIENPRSEVVELSKLLNKSSLVLDVGAGYGNNTKLLLELGHTVTALETNPSAVEALRELEKVFPGKLEVIMDSIDSFNPHHKYDAVICCMVLHFMKNETIGKSVIDNLMVWTKPGGFDVITSYLNTNILNNEYSFLLDKGQLHELYKGWEILWYEESHARTMKNSRNIQDMLRVLRRGKGYEAARIISRKQQ